MSFQICITFFWEKQKYNLKNALSVLFSIQWKASNIVLDPIDFHYIDKAFCLFCDLTDMRVSDGWQNFTLHLPPIIRNTINEVEIKHISLNIHCFASKCYVVCCFVAIVLNEVSP